MTRRYARDNRGRFSSTGATARGGRLRTAAGNKRATQTTRLSGGKASGTIGKPKGLKPGSFKPKAAANLSRGNQQRKSAAKPQVSSARQAATDRLKVKTQTRRAMSANRASVVTPKQQSRLEAGKGATVKGTRLTPIVAKPRTTGNTKQQIQSRVERKLAAEKAKMDIINRAERVGATQGNQRERSYKRQATLERAQAFLTTGKLPGKDNSIAAQRNLRQAKERLAARNAARQRGDIASVNIPMRGARGRALDREISRNIAQQRTQERAANRARNRQFKTEQSRAKALRAAHVSSIAKAKGLTKSQVENALKAQSPAVQIKALKGWVRDNRKTARSAAKESAAQMRRINRATANRERTADTRNKPGSTTYFRPSAKMTRANNLADRALSFYSNPTKALQEVKKKKPGFRLPRGMR